jgi:hypothetical protein
MKAAPTFQVWEGFDRPFSRLRNNSLAKFACSEFARQINFHWKCRRAVSGTSLAGLFIRETHSWLDYEPHADL